MRRSFTVFQIMTILDENHHRFLIVEHDPVLYAYAREMGDVSQALRKAAKDATVLLYTRKIILTLKILPGTLITYPISRKTTLEAIL